MTSVAVAATVTVGAYFPAAVWAGKYSDKVHSYSASSCFAQRSSLISSKRISTSSPNTSASVPT